MVRPKNKAKNKKKVINNKNNTTVPSEKKNKNKCGAYKTFIRNPKISFLNINSHFIYGDTEFKKKFESLKNKNLLKLNENEISFLTRKINEIMIVNSMNNNEEFILLNNDIAEKIKNFKTKISSNDNLTNFIKEKLVNSKNRQGISCRKLSAMYFEETGKYACKTKINNIIKSKLCASKKSYFLFIYLGRILCFSFIKLLMTGFNLLFINKSSIQLNYSNYRFWRKYELQIFFRGNNAGKLNLFIFTKR